MKEKEKILSDFVKSAIEDTIIHCYGKKTYQREELE